MDDVNDIEGVDIFGTDSRWPQAHNVHCFVFIGFPWKLVEI